jgi:hypothetical protein
MRKYTAVRLSTPGKYQSDATDILLDFTDEETGQLGTQHAYEAWLVDGAWVVQDTLTAKPVKVLRGANWIALHPSDLQSWAEGALL